MPRISWLDIAPWLIFGGVAVWAAFQGAPWGVVAVMGGMCVVPIGYMLLKAHLEERARRDGRPESTFENWTLLAVSLVMCAGALVTLKKDPHLGVVMLLFFGGGAALWIAVLRRKLRARRFHALSVSVEGGRNITMRAGHILPIAIGCAVIGAGFASVGPPLIAALGAFVALVGLVLLVLYATGYLRHYLRFEPEGLVIGRFGHEYEVPWDSLVGASAMSISETPLVTLRVDHLAALKVRPASATLKVHKSILRQGIVIAPAQFGMDVPPLLAALERYARNPEARKELVPRLPAPALPGKT